MHEVTSNYSPIRPIEQGISLDGPILNVVFPIEDAKTGKALGNLHRVEYSATRFLREASLYHPISGEAVMAFGLTRAEYTVGVDGEVKNYQFILRPDEEDKENKVIASSIAKAIPKLHPGESYADALFMLFPTISLKSDEGLEFILGIEGYNSDELGPLFKIAKGDLDGIKINEFAGSLLEESDNKPFSKKLASLNTDIPPYSFEIKTLGGVSIDDNGMVPIHMSYDLYAGVALSTLSIEEIDKNIKEIIKKDEVGQDSIFNIIKPYARIVTDDLTSV